MADVDKSFRVDYTNQFDQLFDFKAGDDDIDDDPVFVRESALGGDNRATVREIGQNNFGQSLFGCNDLKLCFFVSRIERIHHHRRREEVNNGVQRNGQNGPTGTGIKYIG